MGVKATAGQKKRKALMIAQDGLCHWCREPMVLPEPYPDQQAQNGMSNLCTVDHLRDRFDMTRWDPHDGTPRHVGACRGCNVNRSLERQKIFKPNPRGGLKNLRTGDVRPPQFRVQSRGRRTVIKFLYWMLRRLT